MLGGMGVVVFLVLSVAVATAVGMENFVKIVEIRSLVTDIHMFERFNTNILTQNSYFIKKSTCNRTRVYVIVMQI